MLTLGGAVGRNLVDLQKTLSGEFTKKIHEWEKLKGGQQWLYNNLSNVSVPGGGPGQRGLAPLGAASEGSLPHDFKKKLHEWEKMKEKERVSQ